MKLRLLENTSSRSRTDRNINIKSPSSPRERTICQFCTGPTVGTLGYVKKNKQIRTEVSSQGKYSALRDVYLLSVASRLFYKTLLTLGKIEAQ